jgi:hypothetical protein
VPRDEVLQLIESGERLGGLFWPDGVDDPTPGILNWAPEHGASLELIQPVGGGNGWPKQLAGKTIAAHGSLNGYRVSLLDAWVNRLNVMDIVASLHASTIAVGDHCTSETSWNRAVYSTANLSEWRRDTGIVPSHSKSRRAKYHTHLRWRIPTADKVELPDAVVRFGGEMSSTGVAFAPDWTIRTWQTLAVDPKNAMTVAELYRRYAEPLMAFTTFVSDRPDALNQEVVIDTGAGLRVRVLRQRQQQVEPRDWRPDHAYLFPVEVLDDYATSIRRWWELYEQVWPALGLFASHINEGNAYSPARFLTLFSAIEAYAAGAHRHTDLKRLRAYAGVPNAVTGCTNKALDLIGASRGYYAHFGSTGQKYSLADVEGNTLESTRRLSALMQACLMRELGIEPAEIEQLLNDHYRNWPIP